MNRNGKGLLGRERYQAVFLPKEAVFYSTPLLSVAGRYCAGIG